MMNVNVMYDDIAYILQSNAPSSHNVHISTATINCLVAVEDQLLRQLYHHITRKHYPQRLILYHPIPQRPRFRVNHIVVGGIRHQIKLPTFSSLRVLPEPDHAVR